VGIDPEQTVVCGDSGNDWRYFLLERNGESLSANRTTEWHNANPAGYRYLAEAGCAGGIGRLELFLPGMISYLKGTVAGIQKKRR